MRQNIQTYKIMDRMRSYSSAFSRNMFVDILKYGDCSRLDGIHEKYDGKEKRKDLFVLSKVSLSSDEY